VFTDRQSDYAARAFRRSDIYTPQLVIDGAFATVGSDHDGVRRAITAAAARRGADVVVHASPAAAGVRVEMSVDVSSVQHRGDSDLIVAVAEDGLMTRVGGGENRGRTLPHSAVVRSLTSIGLLNQNVSSQTVIHDVPLSPAWPVSHLHLVGVLQERTSRRILGASVAVRSPSD
jgi:hypothetical protein